VPWHPIVFRHGGELDFCAPQSPARCHRRDSSRQPLHASISVARAVVVARLDTVSIVGPLGSVVVFRSWVAEIATAIASLTVLAIRLRENV